MGLISKMAEVQPVKEQQILITHSKPTQLLNKNSFLLLLIEMIN